MLLMLVPTIPIELHTSSPEDAKVASALSASRFKSVSGNRDESIVSQLLLFPHHLYGSLAISNIAF